MSQSYFVLSLTLLVLVKADFPHPWEKELHETHTTNLVSRNGDEVYRLPQTVMPVEYDVYIDLYFDERTDRPFSYDGTETIIIKAVEADVTQIVLHSNVDSIDGITVLYEDGRPFPLNVENPIVLEPQYHFLKINLAEALTKDSSYSLIIDYKGTMNVGPMKRGIWRGRYKDANGVERLYAATHFQPYNARQAFPCWDEPLFKAVFKLHLSRPSKYVGRFSNTGIDSSTLLGNDRVRDSFLPTPKMSSYLVTFLVSESFQVIAEDTSFSPPVRVIGRSNTAGLGNHALNLAVKMTEFFDEYFGIPYSSLHQSLMNDHVSSPDWASAGTENWGMVSYRELYLIIDPLETLMSVEHYAATLVSHELAHKWFGNLITCFWWSNTWINEGFASYFGYFATNEKFPEYELVKHFNARYMHTSLATDSANNPQPLNYDVNTPAQVTGHFGTISYSKGAAFLRQTADIISLETFRKACQYFLTDNAYEPTDQYDLYEAFARAASEDDSLSPYINFNFTDYYRIWVNEPGYPVLNVNVDHSTGEIALQQERFFLSASAISSNLIYPIPITYSTQRNPQFEELKPIYIMDTDKIVLNKEPGAEWVIFNNLQHGHYRVNYDSETWDLIADALMNEPETIHYLTRAQIVDDIFALMRSERMTYDHGFRILSFLRHEVNFYVWEAAISGYNWLRNSLRHVPDKQAAFDEYLLSYLERVIEEVGFDAAANETPTATMNRESTLHFACLIRHPGCIEESKKRFVALRDNEEWVHPGIRRNVFVIGVREGGQADFEFMLKRFHESNYANDQLEMLRAMGATRDSALLTRYLELTLTNDVRSHDKVTSFNYALLGNPENADTVLQFVKNNIDTLRTEYVWDSPANPVQSALSNLAAYLDESGLDDYEDWLQKTQANTPQFSAAISAINSARTNIAWARENADMILESARGGAAVVVTSLALVLAMATVAMTSSSL